MTALHSSKEPADLSAGRDHVPGAVGVIARRTTAIPLRPQTDNRAPSEPPGAAALLRRSAMVILHYLDVILVVLLVPVALSLGASAVGYAIGAAAWVAQRIIAHADRRWISATRAPRTQLGLNLFEAFGRIWLL